MRKLFVIALLVGAWIINTNLTAQQLSPRQRAQELAATFTKSKHEVKEKFGIRVEKFKEVRSEPVVKSDVKDYSGTYVATLITGYPIKISVGADGRIEMSGSEPGPKGVLQFTLRDAKIEGGLLTGTKVYTDGSTENFEGVFINRTERDSPTSSGTTSFGLGVLYNPPKTESNNGFTFDKLFYEFQR